MKLETITQFIDFSTQLQNEDDSDLFYPASDRFENLKEIKEDDSDSFYLASDEFDTAERIELSERLKNKKIVILTEGLGGFGDYIAAKKIYSYLHETFNIPLKNMVLGGVNNTDHHTKKILKDKELNFIEGTYQDLISLNPDLQIFAPSGYGLDDRIGLNNTIPTLAIREYGFTKVVYPNTIQNVASHAFGFEMNSLGFIPTPKIRKWAITRRSDSKLQYLAFVSKEIQNAILGEVYSRKAIETFAKTSKLYFGYAHHSSEVKSFINACARMNDLLGDKSDLCFFIMGNDHDIDFSKLHQFGIGGVDFINKESLEFDKKNGNKRLKFISDLVNFRDVPYLHIASEDETLTTGDQTFSEALSAEKFPIYEKYSHKEPLYRQFQRLLPHDLYILTQFYKKINSPMLSEGLDEKTLSEFFLTRRRDPKIANLVETTMKTIGETFDFAPKFDQALLKILNQTKNLQKKQVKSITLPASSITEADIPLNTTLYLKLTDILKLRIQTESGISELPQFSGSLFITHRVTNGFSLIRTCNL